MGLYELSLVKNTKLFKGCNFVDKNIVIEEVRNNGTICDINYVEEDQE